MEALPLEMVIHIVNKLQVLDLLSLNRVSVKFRSIINHKIQDQLKMIHDKWLSLRWMYHINIIGASIRIFVKAAKLGKFKIKHQKIVFHDPNSNEYKKIKCLQKKYFHKYIYQGKCIHKNANDKTIWLFNMKKDKIKDCLKNQTGLIITLANNHKIQYNIWDSKIYVILDIIMTINKLINSKITF